MGWRCKIAGSLRRVWDAVLGGRLQPSKRGRGMGKLYNDVRSCGYEDVHQMWSMLHSSNLESSKRRRISRRHILSRRS